MALHSGVPISKLAEKIKEEVEALIPPTVFFFITLSVVAIVHVLMLRGSGLPASWWLK